ncbi:unnamed protein product [Didymodactylos carnosus]|uniref:Uncharacterized protein n=2 Tax=Didymodactylos carnosus TaxID=1234261 RepID=A0A8S2E8A4_9BILA|nr:unnamed protein product [Didymodactylos carnosus]CAF3840440.1 unnamed protein product [Didymodactylos carnosus]
MNVDGFNIFIQNFSQTLRLITNENVQEFVNTLNSVVADFAVPTLVNQPHVSQLEPLSLISQGFRHTICEAQMNQQQQDVHYRPSKRSRTRLKNDGAEYFRHYSDDHISSQMLETASTTYNTERLTYGSINQLTFAADIEPTYEERYISDMQTKDKNGDRHLNPTWLRSTSGNYLRLFLPSISEQFLKAEKKDLFIEICCLTVLHQDTHQYYIHPKRILDPEYRRGNSDVPNTMNPIYIPIEVEAVKTTNPGSIEIKMCPIRTKISEMNHAAAKDQPLLIFSITGHLPTNVSTPIYKNSQQFQEGFQLDKCHYTFTLVTKNADEQVTGWLTQSLISQELQPTHRWYEMLTYLYAFS